MGVCGSTANKAYKEQQQQQQQPSDEKVSSSLEDAAKDRSRAIDAQLKKDANSFVVVLLPCPQEPRCSLNYIRAGAPTNCFYSACVDLLLSGCTAMSSRQEVS